MTRRLEGLKVRAGDKLHGGSVRSEDQIVKESRLGMQAWSLCMSITMTIYGMS